MYRSFLFLGKIPERAVKKILTHTASSDVFFFLPLRNVEIVMTKKTWYAQLFIKFSMYLPLYFDYYVKKNVCDHYGLYIRLSKLYIPKLYYC